jgi:hypothetical protein
MHEWEPFTVVPGMWTKQHRTEYPASPVVWVGFIYKLQACGLVDCAAGDNTHGNVYVRRACSFIWTS